MQPIEKKQYLETHPDVEQNVAGTLADRLLKRYGGDENKVAYAWNHGSYINPDSITQDTLNNDPYSQKFQRLKTKMATPPVQQQFIDKQQMGKKSPVMLAQNDESDKRSVDDIINDPANPFNKKDDDEDSEDEKEQKRLAIL